MIKVLLVVCNNVLNGSERYVVDLASYLSKEIFDVHIATPIRGPLSDIIAEKNLKEIIYHNNKTIYYSLKGLINLFKIIRLNRYDVVHANAKFHPCVVAKIAGVKLTVETKHGIFYTRRQLSELAFWRKTYERVKQYFTDKIIAISENDKNTLIEIFKIRRSKIKVIYNGLNSEDIFKKIDKEKYDSRTVNRPFVTIFNIGRLTFQKAQEILVLAFKKIKSDYPNAKLVLIGSGENEKMLRILVKKNKLDNSVEFKGYVYDMFNEMLKMDMLVLTSRFEGTPYVIFEAMALKIPVITTNVGGINNIFADGIDCLITECDDPHSTADAIEKLLADHKLRERLTSNASNTIRNYTVQKMTAETASIYLDNLSS